MAEIVPLRPAVEEPPAPSAQVVTLAARINWRSLQMGLNPDRAASQIHSMMLQGRSNDEVRQWWHAHVGAAEKKGLGPYTHDQFRRIMRAYQGEVRARIERLKAETADKAAR